MNLNEILKQRGSVYGKFINHAELSQYLKSCICSQDRLVPLSPIHSEALEMIFHKIARIVNGNPNYIDSWRDIAGYAQAVINELSVTEGATDVKLVRLVVKNGELTEQE